MMKAAMSLALLVAIWGLSSPSPAQAQSDELSAQASKLRRGTYTTPEISRRCQTYARQRVRGDGQDRSREAAFMACVRRLAANAKKS